MRALRTVVHFLIVAALIVDPLIVGWLVYSQTTVAGWLRGALLSLLWIPVLVGLKVLLDLGISGTHPEEDDTLHFRRFLPTGDKGTGRHGRR